MMLNPVDTGGSGIDPLILAQLSDRQFGYDPTVDASYADASGTPAIMAAIRQMVVDLVAEDAIQRQMRGAQTAAGGRSRGVSAGASAGAVASRRSYGRHPKDPGGFDALMNSFGLSGNFAAGRAAAGSALAGGSPTLPNVGGVDTEETRRKRLAAALSGQYRSQLAALAASIARAQTTGTQAADAAASAMRANPSPYQNLQMQRMGDVSNPLMDYMRSLGTSTQQVDATTGLLNQMNRTQNAGMDQLVGNLNTINQNAMSGALNDVERSKQAFVQRLADQRAEEELALQRYYGTRGVRV